MSTGVLMFAQHGGKYVCLRNMEPKYDGDIFKKIGKRENGNNFPLRLQEDGIK